MKNSGIEWIGEIPDSWRVGKLKNHLISYKSGGTPDSSNEEYYTDIGTPWVVIADMTANDYIKDTTKHITDKAIKDKGLEILPKGTILYAMYASVGKVAELAVNATVNQAILGLNFDDEVERQYIKYFLSSWESYIKSESNGTTQFNLNAYKVVNLASIYPSIKEQQRIAQHLDEKCGKIDELIANQQGQIEKLKEYKQSVITEAVTKGLDKSAPLKDSGIEWISNIPDGWSIQKVLYQLKMPVTDGPHTTPELFDSGVAFVSAEAVSCGNGGIDFNHIRGYISEEFYQECCLKYIPEIDDVYMIKSGATTGRVSIVTTLEPKFTIWSPLAVMRTNKNKMLPKFLYYAVQSTHFQRQVALGWSYGTQQNLGMRTLEQLQLLVPSLVEQHGIVEYLDDNLIKIDRLIAIKQEKIEKLQEYKKSLIYEYVTGKKEVS